MISILIIFLFVAVYLFIYSKVEDKKIIEIEKEVVDNVLKNYDFKIS